MLRFAADENFSMHIVSGVLRHLPDADIVGVQDAGLEGADDTVVLEWAAMFEVSLKVPTSVAMKTSCCSRSAVLRTNGRNRSTTCR